MLATFRTGTPFRSERPCDTEAIDHRFYTQDDGQVAVSVGDDLPLLNHALQDSLGTRPPAGGDGEAGPTTYWIDVALSHLRTRLRQQSDEPFAAGNITYLCVRDGAVEARYDVDGPDSESVDRVPAEDFIQLLVAWRDRVGAPV